MYKQAVLLIYYKDKNGKLRHEPQGKFFYDSDGKAIFLADMSQNKVFRFCNGYSISKQIIEAFSELKIKPKIIYRRLDLNMIYKTTSSTFKALGIFGNWANHDQYVLPIKAGNWTTQSGNINDEPKGLPKMDLADWKKSKHFSTERMVDIDIHITIPSDVRAELRKRTLEKIKSAVIISR